MLANSSTRSGAALTFAVASVLLVAPTAIGASDSGGRTSDAQVDVWLSDEIAASEGSPGSSSNNGRAVEWDYQYLCIDSRIRYDLTRGCPNGSPPRIEYCEDGSEATPPLWARWETSPGSGVWGEWQVLRGYTCSADTFFSYRLRLAWQNMPIAPHQITLQPDTGWVFSNVPTIAMVDRNPRQITANIFDRPVLIRALPGTMTWQWGDGHTTLTSDRGSPYPNPTLTHTYAYFEGDVVIHLTSSWSGQYSVDGGATWLPAPGTATTTSTPVPLHVYNPHTHQVDCDLDGVCITG